MSWLSGLAATASPCSSAIARTSLLGMPPSGKRKIVELVGGGAVEEIALVAPGVGAAVKLDPAAVDDPPHVMAGRQAVGAEVAGEGDEVGELHALVAQAARHRRAAARIFVGEAVDDAAAEAAFIVEHVMGDAQPVGDGAGVVNVLAGAAGARAADRFAMVVELHRHADHLGAGARGERGDDAAVDAARHGDDDPRLGGRAQKAEICGHRALFTRSSLLSARREQRRRQFPGGAVSRNEGKIGTGDEAAVDSAPIWAEIAAQARSAPIPRPVAVARYLAGRRRLAGSLDRPSRGIRAAGRQAGMVK